MNEDANKTTNPCWKDAGAKTSNHTFTFAVGCETTDK